MNSILNFLFSEIDDVKIRKFLPYYFSFLYFFTVMGAFVGYLQRDSWSVGDWLINYQGGFVRRGLLGEILYQVSLYTNVNIGFLVFLLQTFLYFVFYFFSCKILLRQKTLLPYLILIFSPFLFAFHLVNLEGGYRKEIIYFSLISFLVWSSYKGHKFFDKVFIFVILIYPFAILSHEILAVFLPYLVSIYIVVRGWESILKQKFFFLFLLSFSFLAFILILIYRGDVSVASKIFQSLHVLGYEISGGAIGYLGGNFWDHGILRVWNYYLRTFDFYYSIFVFFLALIAFLPVWKNILNIFSNNKLVRILLGISVIGTLLLCIVAVDWGRFIYINLVSVFFLLLSYSRNCDFDGVFYDLNKRGVFLFFLLLYALLWNLPHIISHDNFVTKMTNLYRFFLIIYNLFINLF